MAKRLIHYNPATRTTVHTEYDPSSRKTHLITQQDVENHLDFAKRKKAMTSAKSLSSMGDYHHYARVPNNIAHEWLTKYGVNVFDNSHVNKIDALLKGPYKYLTTAHKF